ncbi:substrate-binding periplasmic protein [Rhodoferax sp.]|uniref:substrate-binding periplasmic protein n=1 Tax=Rhodoferax sp. TaxID=50421 RepID=UPI002ACE545B|nr:transporter substrate-binding domain-containing protein [Rhodoferax sp.]MDZ7919450.1 transporter substrate-binding domain-containing protein [Rhodoferax sp.]
MLAFAMMHTIWSRAARSAIGLLFACLLTTANSASIDPAYCSRPVRVALFEFGILYRSALSDGADKRLSDGADKRLLALLEKRTGCQMSVVVLPRSRVWAEMKAGTLDIATAVIATPERESYSYILPYLRTRNVLLINKGAANRARNIRELEESGLRMGAVRSFRHEPSYDALLDKMRQRNLVLEAVDVQENLRFLQRGMVDAVLVQPMVYRAYLSETQIRNDIVVRDWAAPLEASIGGLMLSRATFTEAQAKHWDKLIETIQKDGSQIKTFLPFMSASEAQDLVYTGPRPFGTEPAAP